MFIFADYPLGGIMLSTFIFILWVMWLWCVIMVLVDVFARSDHSGWAKAGWTTLIIFLPFIGVMAYLITNGPDMAKRRTQGYPEKGSMRPGSGAAAAIAEAKELLDEGAINQVEFDTIKRKALAV